MEKGGETSVQYIPGGKAWKLKEQSVREAFCDEIGELRRLTIMKREI